jgi:hypothetical protein
MAEPKEKLVQKSNNITGTPMRGLVAAITLNVKNTGKREQDPRKKIEEHEKEGTVEVFWGGATHAGSIHRRHTDRGS